MYIYMYMYIHIHIPLSSHSIASVSRTEVQRMMEPKMRTTAATADTVAHSQFTVTTFTTRSPLL